MKSISCITVLLFCCIYACIGQHITVSTIISPNSTYVKGNNFEGAVFSSSYSINFINLDITQEFRQYQKNASKRFTPTFTQIELTERILQKNLQRFDFRSPNQGKSYGPIIHRKLKKYQRQYFGYTSASNEEIVFINADWEPYTFTNRIQNLYPRDETWKSDYRIVLDGGSHHWQIEVNLTTGKLSNLNINGLGILLPFSPNQGGFSTSINYAQ